MVADMISALRAIMRPSQALAVAHQLEDQLPSAAKLLEAWYRSWKDVADSRMRDREASAMHHARRLGIG